jgi:hypothetical protein
VKIEGDKHRGIVSMGIEKTFLESEGGPVNDTASTAETIIQRRKPMPSDADRAGMPEGGGMPTEIVTSPFFQRVESNTGPRSVLIMAFPGRLESLERVVSNNLMTDVINQNDITIAKSEEEALLAIEQRFNEKDPPYNRFDLLLVDIKRFVEKDGTMNSVFPRSGERVGSSMTPSTVFSKESRLLLRSAVQMMERGMTVNEKLHMVSRQGRKIYAGFRLLYTLLDDGMVDKSPRYKICLDRERQRDVVSYRVEELAGKVGCHDFIAGKNLELCAPLFESILSTYERHTASDASGARNYLFAAGGGVGKSTTIQAVCRMVKGVARPWTYTNRSKRSCDFEEGVRPLGDFPGGVSDLLEYGLRVDTKGAQFVRDLREIRALHQRGIDCLYVAGMEETVVFENYFPMGNHIFVLDGDATWIEQTLSARVQVGDLPREEFIAAYQNACLVQKKCLGPPVLGQVISGGTFERAKKIKKIIDGHRRSYAPDQ